VLPSELRTPLSPRLKPPVVGSDRGLTGGDVTGCAPLFRAARASSTPWTASIVTESLML